MRVCHLFLLGFQHAEKRLAPRFIGFHPFAISTSPILRLLQQQPPGRVETALCGSGVREFPVNDSDDSQILVEEDFGGPEILGKQPKPPTVWFRQLWRKAPRYSKVSWRAKYLSRASSPSSTASVCSNTSWAMCISPESTAPFVRGRVGLGS
jgi:hypothetical protein